MSPFYMLPLRNINESANTLTLTDNLSPNKPLRAFLEIKPTSPHILPAGVHKKAGGFFMYPGGLFEKGRGLF